MGKAGGGREVALGAAACLGLSCITSLNRVDGPGRILYMYARGVWKDAGREERKDGWKNERVGGRRKELRDGWMPANCSLQGGPI